MDTATLLAKFGDDLADVVAEVDATAEHERWKRGIGPFEEHRQLSMLSTALEGETSYLINGEVPYPNSGEKCDIVLSEAGLEVPIEAKLLRFRYDNGNIDPNSFPKVFSPFPERTSGTLLTDARKLRESEFKPTSGLLGIYYEKYDEEYAELDAERIAEKFCIDVAYWYDFEVETRKIAHFGGLRHPVHQHGAFIIWEIKD